MASGKFPLNSTLTSVCPKPQAVVLLPFIEEERLLAAIAPKEASLTPEEAARNGQRIDMLFMSRYRPKPDNIKIVRLLYFDVLPLVKPTKGYNFPHDYIQFVASTYCSCPARTRWRPRCSRSPTVPPACRASAWRTPLRPWTLR